MKFTMKKAKAILAFGIATLLIIGAYAQKAPMKFGKVPLEDLQMQVYPDDTSAVAAILCNYGYFKVNLVPIDQNRSRIELQFTHMIRIKILKKEGLRWGDKVFPGYSKTDVKGITYNLEDGKVVESKLKNESVFRERVTEDRYRLRAAMPNLKEGSVYDLEFTYSGLPYEWYFQEEIPVRWSELIIEPSQYLEFKKTYFGYISLSVNTDMRWVASKVPAFKTEPYMNSIENYISKFELELLRITIPGNYKDFTTTWDAVNKRLDEDENFGQAMGAALFLNSTAKEIEAQYSSPLDKIKAAYEFVKKSVKWDEKERLYTSSSTLSYPFNKKIGNSADINLILVQLLKKLDFEANPVAMSTRSNGSIRVYSPSFNRLNYVIAHVKVDGKDYLLDATEEKMPFGLLPLRAINERGRIVNPKHTEWAEIPIDKKDKKMIQYDLQLDADDVLTGKIVKTRVDYSAFNFRDDYEAFNSEDEYLKDFEKDNPGLIVENCTLTNLDSIYQPMKEEYDVKIKNKVTRIGDMVYINPMMYEQIIENPFKLDVREYPVDFAYNRETIYLCQLTIPEGYQISQVPKALLMKLPDNSASCVYQVSAAGNKIMLTYKFLINKAMFVQTEYANLKAIFGEIVKKQAEPVVLKVAQ